MNIKYSYSSSQYLNLFFIILVFNDWTCVHSAIGNILDKFKAVKLDVIQPIKNLHDNTKEVLIGSSLAAGVSTYDKFCSLKLKNSISLNFVKPEPNQIKFHLHTQCGNATFTRMRELEEIKIFDIQKKVVLFVTGWTTDVNSEPNLRMKDAFVCRGDINFIIIDVVGYITTFYSWSAENTQLLGDFLGEAIIDLVKIVHIDDIRLVGHSLGAHIMGQAGRRFRQLTGWLLPHITGLDPALPCINATDQLRGLDRECALFVDIIHTNPDILGKQKPMGNVDFYPGGLHYYQPGCFSFICSHARAWIYFLETVYPNYENIFIGNKCATFEKLAAENCNTADKAVMGYNVDTQKEGIYSVDVLPKYPHAPGLGLTQIPKMCPHNVCY